MKKFAVTGICLAIFILWNFACKQKEHIDPNKEIADLLIQQTDSFASVNHQLLKAVTENESLDKLQQLFIQSRSAYKKIEWATEYFVPLGALETNGAPVPEIEASEFEGSPPVVVQPDGLQVIEALLYPAYHTENKDELIERIKKLDESCEKYKKRFENISLLNWQILDALKLEVFRIITLGITGFDAPLSLNSIAEGSAALSDFNTVFSFYQNDTDETINLIQCTNAAIAYLNNHQNNFNDFDRAAFITMYANPLSTAVNQSFKNIQRKAVLYNRFLRQSANTLFDTDAFNVNVFVASFDDTLTGEKAALGKRLFYDPVLSQNQVRSCASCHQADKGYCDGFVKNTVLNSKELLPRNTPTLLNAALQPALFYDSRATTLEDQAKAVVENKNEMHGSLENAAKNLWNNREYRTMFVSAFPQKNKTKIDPEEIQNALASYIRSLSKLNSRFDEYMRGNKNAMSQNEIAGFNLFMGKAKCATCHYMPLFNGTPPPKYTKSESEIIGVPLSAKRAVIDTDLGRYAILKDDFNKHAFKTPTVRNISKTAPYMHNGVFSTLEEVMDFYDKGGGQGLGIHIENQTLPFDKLNLSKKEINDIIAFMKTLDSQ